MENISMRGYYFLSEKGIKKYLTDQLKKNESDIFILINRKGYWDYRVFFPNISRKERERSNRRVVISDRFLEKMPEDELRQFLKGKKVVVYDDSLSNGANLFYYYLLCSYFGAEIVTPVVYALNLDFPSKKSKKLMMRETGRIENSYWKEGNSRESKIREFEGKLKFRFLLGNTDIDRLSIWQTHFFQKEVSPLVMDLPIFNHIQGKTEKKIELTPEQFDSLCRVADPEWDYVENEVRDATGCVKAGYFEFQSQMLGRRFGNLFHDFVVKCKYERSNGSVFVVFTPFAIVRSITFQDAFQCFKTFYENTVYGQRLLHKFPNGEYSAELLEKDHHLCKALFRAVIFRLSDYVGRKFQQFVKNMLDMTLEYDWIIMQDNFDADFIETQKKFYDDFNEEEFRKLVYQCKIEYRVEAINQYHFEGVEKQRATLERVGCHVRSRIAGIKKNITSQLIEQIYTIETIESELEEKFRFADDGEKRQLITCTILAFLETNSFSNQLLCSNEDHVLYRGFRYGENSDIFLHEDLWFFYAYLYAYYVEMNGKELRNNYEIFMSWLEGYLNKKGYLGVWISADGFNFLKSFFASDSERELVENIRRRSYLADCALYGEENAIKVALITEAANSVKQWGKV